MLLKTLRETIHTVLACCSVPELAESIGVSGSVPRRTCIQQNLSNMLNQSAKGHQESGCYTSAGFLH